MSIDTMQDPTAAAHAGGNGGSTALDDEVVQALRKQIAARKVRVDELHAALAEIEPELKRYERALALLTGEAPQLGRKKRDPNAARVRTLPSGISEERMGDIREAILRYCQDHDEFRQVDIRSTLEGTLAKSSIMANAFERMRQDGFIRMARQEGNAKWFRLTREAQREADA